jgi:pyridoxine 4-dehydrogenase
VARQDAIPIPGSSNSDRIAMNSKLVDLTDEDMEELQKAMEAFPVAGERYPSVYAKFLNA